MNLKWSRPRLGAALAVVALSALLWPQRGLTAGAGAPNAAPTAPGAYDPLAIAGQPTPKGLDLTVHDSVRNRDLPIRVYLPAAASFPGISPPVSPGAMPPSPVILFGPGLGGARDGYRFLADHWAARGYVVVALQHPGSDDMVWRTAPAGEAMAALKQAANAENYIVRARDVPAVLNQLEAWNRAAGDPLTGRLDLTKVGLAGHSFGALTTEAVSGQSLGGRGAVLTDRRIRAALAMSPSPPRRGDPASAFGSVRIPWMLMTGTEDASPLGDESAASRLGVYPYLTRAPKYQLVLDQAEHSAFSDRPLPSDRHARDPRYHRVILALSTAFWDEYLRGDPAAADWLNGSGPRSVLGPADRWERAPGRAMKPVKP